MTETIEGHIVKAIDIHNPPPPGSIIYIKAVVDGVMSEDWHTDIRCHQANEGYAARSLWSLLNVNSIDVFEEVQ